MIKQLKQHYQLHFTNKLDFISVIQKLLLRIKRGLDVDVDVDFIFIFIYYGDC